MPLPWQGAGILPKLTGIINLLILLLAINKLMRQKRAHGELNIRVLMTGIYVATLAILMAYTTPNFGSLERYKIGYMPFFLLWILNEKSIMKRIGGLFKN